MKHFFVIHAFVLINGMVFLTEVQGCVLAIGVVQLCSFWVDKYGVGRCDLYLLMNILCE